MKLTQTGQTVVSKKDIGKYYRLYINSTQNNDVMTYSYSYNTEFGAASLEAKLNNLNGKYSPGGGSEYAIGAIVELKEGLLVNGSYEIFTKFTGLLRQRQFEKSESGNTATFVFLDNIVKLQEMDVGGNHTDQIFDSLDKTEIISEDLTENLLTDPGRENLTQVCDFAHSNIAVSPEPIIKVLRKDGSDISGQPTYTGYEINYETGQLTLAIPLNASNYRINAHYWYYPVGTYVEDWIEDVITAPDVYGSNVFTVASNLRTTYQTEEGSGATDTMTYNTAGVEYPVGSNSIYGSGCVWYLDYDNVQDDLVAANFTVDGGAMSAGLFVAFDKRFGRLFLNADYSGHTIICTYNYNFSTLQATGVNIPYIDITSRSVNYRFEALSKLRESLAPNYIIMTRGSGKIWGRYLFEKTTEDYTLYLTKSLNYAEDINDLFTRVKLYGQSNNPHNYMMSTTSTFTKGLEYQIHVDELPLVYAGDDLGGGWKRYTAATVSGIMAIDQSKPIKIWFNDVQLGSTGGQHRVYKTRVPVHVMTDSSRRTYDQSEYFVYFEDPGILWADVAPIQFYDANGINMYNLSKPHFPSSDGVTYYYPGTSIPIVFNAYDGYWQIPENMTDNERIFYIGYAQPFRGIQIQMNTPGADYNLRFEYASNCQSSQYDQTGSGSWLPMGPVVTGFPTGAPIVGGYPVGYFNIHVPLVTNNLVSWGNRASGSGKGMNSDGSFTYGTLSDFYADWGGFMNDWQLVTINPKVENSGYYYWIRIRVKGTPSSVGTMLRAGVIISDWSRPDNWGGLSGCSEWRRDTNSFTDYRDALNAGTGACPLLETTSFHQSVHSASYTVYHPANNWMISENRYFLIPSDIFPENFVKDVNANVVKATFDYITSPPETINFDKLRDGDPATQWQLTMYRSLAAGQVIFTVDFGEAKDIDAIDITAGFFNPDSTTSVGAPSTHYDIKNWFSIKYSNDNITYNYINKDTYNFPLQGGESKSFETDVLGEGFQARYLQVTAEQCSMVDYLDGRWVIAIVDFAVWGNIMIKAESTLAATDSEATTTSAITTVADPNNIRTKIGEKVYKVNDINKNLMTFKSCGDRAYNLLKEYIKNSSRATVDVLYSPHLELGQTVKVIDSVNGINRNYFIEGISCSSGAITLQLAYYS